MNSKLIQLVRDCVNDGDMFTIFVDGELVLNNCVEAALIMFVIGYYIREGNFILMIAVSKMEPANYKVMELQKGSFDLH